MAMPRDSALTAWLPVAVWALVILGLGSDAFSAQNTSHFFAPLIEWLWPGIQASTQRELLSGLRKAAHAVEYGVLALLTFRALRLVTDRSATVCAAATLLLVAGLARADEGGQAQSKLRTGSMQDVRLDVAAGAAVLGLLLATELARGRPLWRRPEPGT